MLVRKSVIGKSAVIAGIVAFAALTVPTAAQANEGYPPNSPGGSSLAGSVAVGECANDAPYIDYNLTLTDESGQDLNAPASLVISSGGSSTTVPLGTLENGKLDGRILWPGATLDDEGKPSGYPGWALVDGEWVETGGNFGWTRGDISAEIVVNPTLSVPLHYPASSSDCAASPAGDIELPFTDQSSALELAFTGSNAPLTILAIGGGAAALVGGGLLVGRRLARR